MRTTSVERLLNRAFGTLMVLILAAGAAGIAASALQYQSIQLLTERVVPLRLANKQLHNEMSQAQSALRGYLLLGDPALLAEHRRHAAQQPLAVARMRELARVDADRADIDDQDLAAQAWRDHALVQTRTAPRSAAALVTSERGRRLYAPMIVANARMDARLAADADRLRARAATIRSVTLTTSLLTIIAAALVAALTAVRVFSRINAPLQDIVRVLDRLRHGEVGVRAPDNSGLVEIRAVVQALNELADTNDRARRSAAERTRLDGAAREVGIDIRQHMSVASAIEAAAAGLGRMLAAEHVLVRLPDGQNCLWSDADAAPDASDALRRYLDLPLELALFDTDTSSFGWAADQPGPTPLSDRQADVLTAAGAHSVLVIAFRDPDTPAIGTVTVVRTEPDAAAAFTEGEVQVTEGLVAGFRRGLAKAQLFEQEQELVRRLKALDQAKTDFMSTVSHELRTPLTSISGYLEMLRDGDAGEISDDQDRMLAVIERNTSRLRSLIEDLLVLSRIEAGALRLHRSPCDIGPLVDAAVAAMLPAAEENGVQLNAEIETGLVAFVDPAQFDRVLVNLLNNAVKFTPGGGEVTVLARHDADGVLVRVADTGIGIPEAEQPELFTRFFRASNAIERAIPGTGLGLPIVRTIIVRHGGHIAVESALDRGTIVTVRVPDQAHTPAETQPAAVGAPEAP
ncbi:ATP-binding protein [Pilimelia columellifera]|uniref:histidine kinase n=1 Tax=Pilimelia columellifera subsp. columellifera TaxID=706583 RepID=A0ABP6AXS4_9ACTN